MSQQPHSSIGAGAAFEPIDRARLDARLHGAACAWPLEIVETTGSTNADLAARLKTIPHTRAALAEAPAGTGFAAPLVRVAYEQTAGRGRQGRPWFAEPGNALLCSVAGVLPRPLDGLAGLSLAVGTALAEGLGTLPLGAGNGVALKWPNDLLAMHDGAPAGKLGGILIETVWHAPGCCALVIGFGINVRGQQAVADAIDTLRAADASLVPATPPAALGAAWPGANLTDVLGAALDALAPALDTFAAHGFAPFQARWDARHAYAGCEVALFERGVEVARGRAAGIDAAGQLLLDTPDGVRAYLAGDVSLRTADAGGAS